MGDESQRLLAKYSEVPSGAEEGVFREKVLGTVPAWESYTQTRSVASLLGNLKGDLPAQDLKQAIVKQPQILQACMQAMLIQPDSQPLQYVLTILFDLIREDSSTFGLFAEALESKVDFWKPFTSLLGNRKMDPYVADKVAYLLTSIMAHSPKFFSDEDLDFVVSKLCGGDQGAATTELGALDAITNLLKLDRYRARVFKNAEVSSRIFRVQKGAPTPLVYKSAFCVWLLCFDKEIMPSLSTHNVIEHMKGILQVCRAEKVVRVCLNVLRNALTEPKLSEDIVEKDLLESVSALEYEKWRDVELYDEIRDMTKLIREQVLALSSFDRYERELNGGQLRWGFIHEPKFWSENVMKFEANQFRAVKALAALLNCTHAETLAVACHDIGEFVQLHPIGKLKANEFNVKEKIMELMAHPEREVRREALLCCQKIMLQNWQDLPAAN